MENNNIVVNQTDLRLDKVIARFIEYIEANTGTDKAEADLNLETYKKEQGAKTANDHYQDYLNQISINTCQTMLDIIGSKVFIVTGIELGDDPDVQFDDVFEIFKTSVEHVEYVFSHEGKNLYEQQLFHVIDAITSVSASNIIDKYFSETEREINSNSTN